MTTRDHTFKPSQLDLARRLRREAIVHAVRCPSCGARGLLYVANTAEPDQPVHQIVVRFRCDNQMRARHASPSDAELLTAALTNI